MFLILMATLLQPQAGQPPLSPVVPPAPAKPQYPSSVGGKTLAEWLKELNDNKDAAIREMAVKMIPAFGPAARDPSIKPLVKACREDGDPGVRVNAILTLGVVGANNKDEAKIIIDALRIAIANAPPGGVVRLHATRAIGNYGMFPEQANDAIPTLRDIAKDLSWETRKTVAFALGRIGGPTKEKPKPDPKPLPFGSPPPIVDPKTGPENSALKALQGMLGDSSATVRIEVVESLVMLGPPAVSLDKYSAAISPYMTAIQDRMKIEKEKGVSIWLHILQMRFHLSGIFIDELFEFDCLEQIPIRVRDVIDQFASVAVVLFVGCLRGIIGDSGAALQPKPCEDGLLQRDTKVIVIDNRG